MPEVSVLGSFLRGDERARRRDGVERGVYTIVTWVDKYYVIVFKKINLRKPVNDVSPRTIVRFFGSLLSLLDFMFISRGIW